MAWRAFDNSKYTKRMIAIAKQVAAAVEKKKKSTKKSTKATKGKEKSICFAFMPDKGTGKHEFALDTGIPGEMLFKKLRTHCNARRGKEKEKKLTKGAFGTCQIKGKTLYVTPEQDVPSLRMLLKKRLLSEEFKEFKLSECRILKPGEEPPEEPDEEAQESDDTAASQTKKASKEDAVAETAAAQTKTSSKESAEPQAASQASSQTKTSTKEQAAPTGDVNPFSGESVAASAATKTSTKEQAAPRDDVNPFSGESVAASAATKTSAKEQTAVKGDVNPFTGEAATSTKASQSKQGAKLDPKQAAKDKKDAQKKRAAFKKARQVWVKARTKADEDIEVLKKAFRKEYAEDPQIGTVTARLKELDSELDDLGDDLRAVLDGYVGTPLGDAKGLEKQAEKARKLIKQFSSTVDKSELLAAVDAESGVGDASKVKIQAPLSKALKSLAKTIA